jgi:hypothetical protein
MNRPAQDAVCAFVRDIVAARSGELVALIDRPDVTHRNVEAPDESWQSPTRSYAVEHTLVESFERQIENTATIKRLLTPVKDKLAGHLPGYFLLAVQEQQTSVARVNFDVVHQEVARLVLEVAEDMSVGETVLLRSGKVPFEMQLHLRHRQSSHLVLQSTIEGDPAELRLERFRRAFTKKGPKLAAWTGDGRRSVFVLESNDDHANYSLSYEAVQRILAERSDQPDIIVYVETDACPWSAWVFKDGERVGNAALRNRDGGYRYERGRVR